MLSFSGYDNCRTVPGRESDRLAPAQSAGRRLHHAPMSSINYKRPVLRSLILILRARDYNISIVGFACSQSLFLDLMTNGTGDSVSRRTMLGVRRRYGKMGK